LKDCKKNRRSKVKTGLPFANCYVCGEKGHIARDCEENKKGLYYKGGGCFKCGSVRHIAMHCPNRKQKE